MSIEERLLSIKVALENSQASEPIQAALAEYGYDGDRIATGRKLYDAAQAAVRQQKNEYSEQFAASEALDRAWETARRSYMRLVKLARIAFKTDSGTLAQLALNGERSRTLGVWLEQARSFFENTLAQPAILAGLGQFGVTADQVRAAQADAQAVEAARTKQLREKGEAQSATKRRDEALAELDSWFSDFVAIARIALEDQPQLLEALGIIVPS